MKPFFERLLDFFKISESEYYELTAKVSSSDFDKGHSFDKMDEVVSFVKNFVNNNKKILIYGDYDADGIMATSIMVKMFNYVNYKVDYYIPNRYLDGYGLNIKHAQEYIDNHYDLIITVDNGITAFEPIKMLKESGIAVCVFDHHEMQEKLPDCDYLLHPIISNFGNTAASGGFVAFMFSKAFLGRYDKYLATLASISLISDTMPLREYNRNLLKVVFEEYQPGEFYNLDLLMGGSNELNENVIGMRVAPRINAVGRLLDDLSINDLVDYFNSNDNEKILNYFNWIDSVNEQRKDISKNAIDGDLVIDENQSSFVLNLNVKEGVIGLIATHLVNVYSKPAIVFTESSENGVLKGSIRTPEGYNAMEIFDKLKDFLMACGGHAHAGGCSIKAENFPKFKEEFERIVDGIETVVEEKERIDLLMNDLTFTNLSLYTALAPFGEGFRAPLFVLPRIRTSALTFSKNLEHIMTQVGNNVRLIGWGIGKDSLPDAPYIDLIGNMRKNEFRGFVNLEFNIQEIKVSVR